MDPNPQKAQPGWPAAVVAGGFQTGVVLMRSLSRRGVRVYCVDPNPKQPAFRTVYGEAHLCPSPDDQPDAWLRFMQDLAAKIGGKAALIPSSDQFVSAIGRHADQLEKNYLFCYSSAAVQALLATKERQYEIAEAHGLPVPRTSFVRTAAEVAAFASTARFPCILKPLHFREWKRTSRDHPFFDKKLVVSRSAAELEEHYRLASEISNEVVVQEMIEGPDTAKMCYLSCYSREGERIASCMVRQLRTDPIYFGSASVVEPIDDPETDAVCDRFLRGVSYVGLCEIELKRDTRDGVVKMIEANPRYSVTADAANYAGVDLGWINYLDLIGQRVIPVKPSVWNFRHVVLFRDFATYHNYLREGLLSWADILRAYRPPVGFFDFDLRDWRVTMGNSIRLMKLLAKPLFRRVSPKKATPGAY